MLKNISYKALGCNLLGGCILAFGLYHVHSFAAVTEGGQLGLTLLLQHWFHISPAFSSLVLNIICYGIGWKTMGLPFLFCSAAAALGFSGCFWICEQFPPLWPQLAQLPLLAALLGSVFVGIGVGLYPPKPHFVLCTDRVSFQLNDRCDPAVGQQKGANQ